MHGVHVEGVPFARDGVRFTCDFDDLLRTNHPDTPTRTSVRISPPTVMPRQPEIHQSVVLLLARQTPVAGDLRILAALLHVIRYVERMGAQCSNIAKLVPLSGTQPTTDNEIREAIAQMAQLARGQVVQAKEAFKSRDVTLAQDLVGQDAGIARLSRELFYRSVAIGDDIDVREWAMLMVLVARCLERIGENAVAIAEQTVFVVSGLFREFAGPPQFT